MRPQLFQRFLVAFLLPTFGCVMVLFLLASWYVTNLRFQEERGRLETIALATAIQARLSPQSPATEPRIRDIGSDTGRSITVFDARGRLMADSRGLRVTDTEVTGSRDFSGALSGETGYVLRWNSVTGQREMMVAAPVRGDAGQVVRVVRISHPVREVYAVIAWDVLWIGIAALFVLGAATATSIVLAQRFSNPIEKMRASAERFGQGHLDRPVPPSARDDLHELADTLNRMAHQLNERIGELTRERNERIAILESLREGVVAIDHDERILNLNNAAEQMLAISKGSSRGFLVQEAIRNTEVQRFLRGALRNDPGLTDEGVVVRIQGKMLVDLRSAPLLDEQGESLGVLLIMTNVTRIHELENLRREFVANVSHELRTPITSISGSAETLLDGALEDSVQARRFVEIISRQAQRLGATIDDLLSLSRLDRADHPDMEVCRVADLLQGAVDNALPLAMQNKTELVVECDEDLEATLNIGLIERAVGNLLENAIKYSGFGARVVTRARREDDSLVIMVTDNGPGIAAEHIPRLFERFYRADKARSREMGGTGLGLSIVKNVAIAHGGTIEVDTALGSGSTFRLTLPMRIEESAATPEDS